ncbi:MAG TPA: queuosine salvage family protein [Solirubrobacteraceae bacterium]|nr:queuosine salvage family protein [Solirubrobacteraceae bacterium]
MTDLLSALRDACAQVAARSRQVRIDESAIPGYAERLSSEPAPGGGPDPHSHLTEGSREDRAAFWLTLDAINFGSGWFPTLRKRAARSGYHTIASGLTDHGPWRIDELRRIDAAAVALALGQDPEHELMALFADSLRDLGRRVAEAGSFTAVVDEAGGSAANLVERLAGWRCFADGSCYDGFRVPFLKRAQITAADLHRAGVARFTDLGRLTMFADNLVPHVLRLDGVLAYDPGLVARIDRGELIGHGSPEEVEIRACALQAVELIVAGRPGTRAADLDQQLWLRGQGEHYKARPRHRARCTAY